MVSLHPGTLFSVTMIIIVATLRQSSSLYVQLDTFLGYSKHCYIQVFIYKNSVDLLSIEYPVVLWIAKTKLKRRVKVTAVGNFPPNYFTRPAGCVTVLLLYSRDRKEIGDAYDYLRYYWLVSWKHGMQILPGRVRLSVLVSPNIGIQCKSLLHFTNLVR